ncbi:hypothetical protein RJ55_04427 [Drechmeria coniospora]|nr:hypothetical protein RJ55_04427 [Drechmeria coniospora]
MASSVCRRPTIPPIGGAPQEQGPALLRRDPFTGRKPNPCITPKSTAKRKRRLCCQDSLESRQSCVDSWFRSPWGRTMTPHTAADPTTTSCLERASGLEGKPVQGTEARSWRLARSPGDEMAVCGPDHRPCLPCTVAGFVPKAATQAARHMPNHEVVFYRMLPGGRLAAGSLRGPGSPLAVYACICPGFRSTENPPDEYASPPPSSGSPWTRSCRWPLEAPKSFIRRPVGDSRGTQHPSRRGQRGKHPAAPIRQGRPTSFVWDKEWNRGPKLDQGRSRQVAGCPSASAWRWCNMD